MYDAKHKVFVIIFNLLTMYVREENMILFLSINGMWIIQGSVVVILSLTTHVRKTQRILLLLMIYKQFIGTKRSSHSLISDV